MTIEHKTKPVHLSGKGNQACIRRGVKGNQVEFLGDPVTVIGSFWQLQPLGDERLRQGTQEGEVPEKACQER